MGMEVVEKINAFFSINVDVAEFTATTDMSPLSELRTLSSRIGSSNGSLTPTTATLSSDKQDFQPAYLLTSHPRLSGRSLSAALEAFDMIREEFEAFAREKGCDKFWPPVYPAQTGLIVAYITEAFTKLGCDISSLQAGEKISSVPYLPKYDKHVVQLIRALRDDVLVIQVDNDWIRTGKPVSV
ncbi:hypothetical protein BGW36DRAFT_408407 [Talaromyces proteolyticus]|uniref:Methyltransferase fungal type helix-turn-helix domain-containing protein n=1 Tax=Talaromyces proteolyticus TaxID=1131652 RepID=A0AAD4Q058_9EURO|nr:uncharacterized protein BGW36DRAFT_408407 [Talaromyces proteolyticus]KAH8696563.1 hypothetical protein BGW36DRAFT_408407 [Talaromyces proteolyticus]